MQPQIAYSRSPLFQEFLGRLLTLEEFPQDDLLGVAIEFHPVWWRLVTLAAALGGAEAPFILPAAIVSPQPLPALPRPDPAWRSHDWEDFCGKQGKSPEPFLVKICYRPGLAAAALTRLRGALREWPIFAVAEERRVAVAAGFTGGGRIDATAPGTLGGYFQDGNGAGVIGLTCGHVAQDAGRAVDLVDMKGVRQTQAGTVLHSAFPALRPLAAGQPCNRAVPGIAAAVDIALIGMGWANGPFVISHDYIDEILDRTQFGSGDAVEMRGAASGHHAYFIGAYDVVYKILFADGQLRCFEHMFEISRTAWSSPWTPPALAAKAVQGDSGACVCRPSARGNLAYCGTLVAVDGTNGYACFAESVRDWAAAQTPAVDLRPL